MKRVKVVYPESHENDWARGCEKCKHGIVQAAELTGAGSLYLERLVQAIDGDIQFCTCRAGVAYRANLRNRLEELKGAAKRDSRMADAAKRGTHPDIEATRHAMHATFGKMARVPTVRYVAQETEPTPEVVKEPTP